MSGGQEDALADPDNESVGETFFVVPVDWMSKISYFLTLPLKAAIYWTVPDVRRVGREGAALQSIGMCVVWLALMTYALIEGLSEIANLLKINSSVMGLTMGAWAASYPALWSSVVVARSGFGDMAMCNALGSNIFSNFIGLGLPWLFYAIIYRRPYAVLEDEGVVLSLSVLLMVLLVTYVVIAASGWTLRAW